MCARKGIKIQFLEVPLYLYYCISVDIYKTITCDYPCMVIVNERKKTLTREWVFAN